MRQEKTSEPPPIEKCSPGRGFYQNIRPNTNKKWGYLLVSPLFISPSGREGTRKGGTSPQTGAKTCRWHVFSPWESPSDLRTHPGGVWIEISPMFAATPLRRRGLDRAAPLRYTLFARDHGGSSYIRHFRKPEFYSQFSLYLRFTSPH